MKKMLLKSGNYFCKVLFFLLISGSAFSQNTAKVFGKITDKESGAAIEFVSVSVIGLPGATQTDAKGNYELRLPPQYPSPTIEIGRAHV